MGNSRIKILMVIDESKMGGGQQHLLWLAKGLDKNKFSVEVACEEKGYLVDELNRLGIKVHPIKISNRPSIKAVKSMIRLIKSTSPNIIHSHGGTAGFYNRICSIFTPGITVIHTYHGIHYLNNKNTLKKRVFKTIDKLLLKITDCTICVSEGDFKIGLKAGVVKKEKAAVIHNGVDTRRFMKSELEILDQQKKFSKNSPIVIGSIGRLHYQKGYEYLIKASRIILNEHPDAKFMLVGDGELRESLESLCKTNHVYDSFIFTGNKNIIDEYLSKMDIFVLPSLWEGLPLVLLEAMAAGKPIVASNINGVSEIIEAGKDGLLVSPQKPELLAESVLELINDDVLRKSFVINGYQKVCARFSVEKMIHETENVYMHYYRE